MKTLFIFLIFLFITVNAYALHEREIQIITFTAVRNRVIVEPDYPKTREIYSIYFGEYTGVMTDEIRETTADELQKRIDRISNMTNEGYMQAKETEGWLILPFFIHGDGDYEIHKLEGGVDYILNATGIEPPVVFYEYNGERTQ